MLSIGRIPPGSTPVPWRQLIVLMSVRLSEPVTYSLIFPFVNQMVVEETKVAPEDVGFYSGLVEGVFALVQFLCVYRWGSLSDRLGRRPVILIGVAGVGLSGLLFGLSKSLTMMIFTRSLSGMLSGNVAVVKASLGEITDNTNQAVVFPLYGLCWIIGTIIGTTLGGYASHPVENYPQWFGGSTFLVKYPYFLPCVVAAGISLVGWVIAWFLLEETLQKGSSCGYEPLRADEEESVELLDSPSPTTPSTWSPATSTSRYLPFRSHRRNASSIWNASRFAMPTFGRSSPSAATAEWTAAKLLNLPLVKRVVISCFSLNAVQGAWSAVYLLVCYSPIEDGGLGLQSSQTGLTLACTGVWSLVFQFAFLPPLQLRLGVKRLYQTLCLGYPLLFALLPFINWLANVTKSTTSPEGAKLSFSVWTGLYLALFISVPVLSTGSVVMILVNRSSPHRSALGKINGLTTMSGSLSRAVGPSVASALFAVSHSHPTQTGDQKILGGHLWWVSLVFASFVNLGLSTTLGDDETELKSSLSVVGEDEEERVGGEDSEEDVALKEGRARVKLEHEGEMEAHLR